MATLRLMQGQYDLKNINIKTKFEEIGVYNCMMCYKLLCRGIDTDVNCDICWDKMMPPDENNYDLYKKVNDKYSKLVQNAKTL